jgi:hypothetical protein
MRQLEPVWTTVNAKTKQLVRDLKSLRAVGSNLVGIEADLDISLMHRTAGDGLCQLLSIPRVDASQ